MTRPRTSISAYACEPDRGYGLGVGLRWTNGLSGWVSAHSVDLHHFAPHGNMGLAQLLRDLMAETRTGIPEP